MMWAQEAVPSLSFVGATTFALFNHPNSGRLIGSHRIPRDQETGHAPAEPAKRNKDDIYIPSTVRSMGFSLDSNPSRLSTVIAWRLFI